jgi:RNA-directed DNA polymerase
MSETKPFCISKEKVMQSWESVKANKGSCGIDNESIDEFESDIKNNLYKLWNRMSSGSYFPSAVKAVEIPKSGGGLKETRLLGIPTVSDRVAQMVAKLYLEPNVEPIFHEDSFGYRPKKSAIEAVGMARKRAWHHDWVVDLDIKGFFDNLDHDLIMKAVLFHTKERWIHLYVARWLKAPIATKDGIGKERNCGTPQGGVISPLLSNIFMHYAFDKWMQTHFPSIKFERFADDAVVHCKTQKQAKMILEVIRKRLKECGLELHPEKTKIVYCKDSMRKDSFLNEKFDFLGYTFRPRLSKRRSGEIFVNFTPAISEKASNRIRKEIRSWQIHLRSDKSITDIARMFNSKVQGWVNYYGVYYKSAMYPFLRNIERNLIRWSMRKYKRLKGHKRRAKQWLGQIRKREPKLFVHWKMGLGSPVG